MQGQPIASHTRTRLEGRRDPTRSSSRRRRTSSGGRGGRSEAARADVAEGSGSSSEGAHAAPVGEATSAFRGGGMYEVGSSSQQPPRSQPQVDPGWSGPILSLPPPTETEAGAEAGAGGEVTPRTAQFYGMMGLRPPAP